MRDNSLLDAKLKLKEAENNYNRIKEKGIDNLNKIKKGCKFGFSDMLGFYDSYFPLTLLEVISEEDCLIKVIEKGRPNPVEEVICTYDIFIPNW